MDLSSPTTFPPEPAERIIVRSTNPPIQRGDSFPARLLSRLLLSANRARSQTNRADSQQFPFLPARALRSPRVASSNPGYIPLCLDCRCAPQHATAETVHLSTISQFPLALVAIRF